MNIYVFTSEVGSHNDGDYYFAAERMEEAAAMAAKFQRKHNRDHHAKDRPAYIIMFSADAEIFEVKPGYLPLNRSEIEHTLTADLQHLS